MRYIGYFALCIFTFAFLWSLVLAAPKCTASTPSVMLGGTLSGGCKNGKF